MTVSNKTPVGARLPHDAGIAASRVNFDIALEKAPWKEHFGSARNRVADSSLALRPPT
jgi:hypothetical protein